MRFYGHPVLSSSDYRVSADAFSSNDGGDHWTLAGSVRFDSMVDEGYGISGEHFVFDRVENTLATDAPIAIIGFSTDAAEAGFSAERIMIDLEKRKVSLVGAASFNFGIYRLDAEGMEVDLAAATLTAPNGGYFRQGQSELHAEYVVVTFQNGEAVLEASELAGRVRLEGVE